MPLSEERYFWSKRGERERMCFQCFSNGMKIRQVPAKQYRSYDESTRSHIHRNSQINAIIGRAPESIFCSFATEKEETKTSSFQKRKKGKFRTRLPFQPVIMDVFGLGCKKFRGNFLAL